jgi:Spy/CpxP family protein refolding chaperone
MKKRFYWTAGLAMILATTMAWAQGPRGPRVGGPGTLGAPGALAGPGPGGFGGGMAQGGELLSPLMGRLLGLTDAQKEAIQAEMKAAREAAQPLREQMRNVQTQIGEAVKSGASESVLTGLADQSGSLSGKLLAISLKSRSKIYNTILTAEQRTKLEELRNEMRDRRGNRMNRRGGPGTPPAAPQAAPNAGAM